MVLHANCRGAYAKKYNNGNQGAVKVFYGCISLHDGNRSEHLSLFHSLTCKNNVTLDYYGDWQTETVSFTHG